MKKVYLILATHSDHSIFLTKVFAKKIDAEGYACYLNLRRNDVRYSVVRVNMYVESAFVDELMSL